MLCDNSPATAKDDHPLSGWLYVNDPSNGGLSRAYNRALDGARQLHCDWLLLLDQDTTLPPDFLEELLRAIDISMANTEIAAIVPMIWMGSRQISPVIPKLGRDTPFTLRNSIAPEWLMAINSATAVRLEFIESIGGFSDEFWLDYLDHWLFRKIYDSQKKVFVSGLCVQHDLSVADLNQGMTPERYHNILAAEALFTNNYLGMPWRVALVFRLLARGLKHSLITRRKELSIMMFRAATTQIVGLSRSADNLQMRSKERSAMGADTRRKYGDGSRN